MIDIKDISVVVQGPVDKNVTPEVLSSIRTFLPNAVIILSTWEGSDIEGLDFDKLVLNEDPKSYYCDVNQNILYNLNRQLISTQNGLKLVETEYALKLRSDLYFTKNDFLSYFDQFEIRKEEFSFFKHRVIVSSLTSKMYSDSPENSFPLPFHVSDWFFFGYTQDVQDYFDIPLLDEQSASKYPCDKNKVPVPFYSWQFAPEQYFCLQWAKKYMNIDFKDWSDWNNINIEQSNQIVASNFIVLDTIQHGLYSRKHFQFINNNDGEIYSFQGYISHLKFLELYRKYCDEKLEIPLSLYYTRFESYNKLLCKYRKYSIKRDLKLFNYIKKIVIKFRLWMIKQYLNSKLNVERNYDLIIPISTCRQTYYLNKFKLRYMSLPFDYMCNFTLLDACNLIRNDFKGFLQKVRIMEEKDTENSIYYNVIDEVYNIVSLHHYQRSYDFEKERNRVYKLFQERCKRLHIFLQKNVKVCFQTAGADINDIKYFIDCLNEKYPCLLVDVMNTIQDENQDQIKENVVYYSNSKITNYVFKDCYTGDNEDYKWIGNEKHWQEIVKNIKMSPYFKFKCFCAFFLKHKRKTGVRIHD